MKRVARYFGMVSSIKVAKNLHIASGNKHRQDIGYGIGRRPETHQYLRIGIAGEENIPVRSTP
jgi:hypothetical protein